MGPEANVEASVNAGILEGKLLAANPLRKKLVLKSSFATARLHRPQHLASETGDFNTYKASKS